MQTRTAGNVIYNRIFCHTPSLLNYFNLIQVKMQYPVTDYVMVYVEVMNDVSTIKGYAVGRQVNAKGSSGKAQYVSNRILQI